LKITETAKKLPQAGYALPAVLTIVTILTLIYMVCILSLENLRRQTVATVQNAELERAALTAEAQFTFLGLTQPLNANSLQVGGVRVQTADLFTGGAHTTPGFAATINANTVTPIMLDDRPYVWQERPQDKASSSYMISIQDSAGLVNLDRVDQDTVARLLHAVGLGGDLAGRAAQSLIALRSPATLSSQEQTQVGWARPLAPDGLMRRYFEIFAAQDLMQDLTVAQRRRFTDLTYLRPDYSGLNINTAPVEALQSWFNMTDIDAAQIVGRRAAETFYSLGQIGITSNNDSGAYTFPSGGFRFSLISPGSQVLYRSSIVLTPGSFERPFWVEGARVQPTAPHTSNQSNAPQPFPTAPADASQSGREP
jgi:type II secretory pathway component PulK